MGWLFLLAFLGTILGAGLTLAADKSPFQGNNLNLTLVGNNDSAGLTDEDNTIAVYDRAKEGVVMVLTQYGSPDRIGNGSGFFWDRKGHVVTNYHVVEGAQSIVIHTFAGDSYNVRVVGMDRLTDLAVLEIVGATPEVVPLMRGNSDQVKVGQKAIVLGSPLASGSSLGLDRSPSITTGVISAKDRSLPIESEVKPGVTDFTIENLLQTDAAVNPGNSGGPLLDSHGRVVGIVTAIIDSANGIGFAIPINVAETVVPQLIQYGQVKRAFLGISYLPLDTLSRTLGDEFKTLNLPDKGALITEVDTGGPAEKAGLLGGTRVVTLQGQNIVLGGDIIVSLDGKVIYGENLLSEILKYSPGSRVTVEVLRNGKRLTFKVVLGSR